MNQILVYHVVNGLLVRKGRDAYNPAPPVDPTPDPTVLIPSDTLFPSNTLIPMG